MKQVDGEKIRILLLEDSPADAGLVMERLRKDGLNHEMIIVNNEPNYKQALSTDKFDIILSDYSLPLYDGASALKYAMENIPIFPLSMLPEPLRGSRGGEPAQWRQRFYPQGQSN
jgi:CheY-like chemotaxis protein